MVNRKSVKSIKAPISWNGLISKLQKFGDNLPRNGKKYTPFRYHIEFVEGYYPTHTIASVLEKHKYNSEFADRDTTSVLYETPMRLSKDVAKEIKSLEGVLGFRLMNYLR